MTVFADEEDLTGIFAVSVLTPRQLRRRAGTWVRHPLRVALGLLGAWVPLGPLLKCNAKGTP